MKKSSLLFLFFTFISAFCLGQTIGTKKTVVLKLVWYECGDFCDMEMKDPKTGSKYSIQSVDEKTRGFEVISDSEDPGKLFGKSFKVELEYRYTDLLEYFSPDEPPRKKGKEKRWMINSLSRM